MRLRNFQGLADDVRRMARMVDVPSFDVRDHAPQTFADTVRGYAERHRFTIWPGGTETAIYGEPVANWQFRAWHDYCHVRSGLGFAVTDEVTLASWQAWEASRIGDLFAEIVWLEIAGQALEYQRTGEFLKDQASWTLAQLNH